MREKKRTDFFLVMLVGTGLSNTDAFAMSLVLQSLDHQLQVISHASLSIAPLSNVQLFLFFFAVAEKQD